MKAYKVILKVTKFQFPTLYSLPSTLLAQKREKHGLLGLRSYSDTRVIKFIVGNYYWSLHLNI